MKTISLFIFTLNIFCVVPALSQKPDNKKPMYGEVEKTEEYLKIDEEFKKTCLKQFGSVDSSVKVSLKNAWIYYYNNDLITAMKRFNQVWLLNPEVPDVYFGFAALSESNGDTLAAKRFYKMGVDKDSSNERVKICYQHIANCKEQVLDFSGAADAYSRLAEIDPTNNLAFKKMGYLFMLGGDSEAAFEAYNKAIDLDPNDAMTYSNRGYLFQSQRNYPKAIEDYTQAIEIDPKYINSYVNRGMTFIEMEDYENAKTDFEKAVKLDKSSGELRRLLGTSRLYLQDLSGACSDFKKAKEMGDHFAIRLFEKNCE